MSNRIKSAFIGVYPMAAMAVIGVAGHRLYLTRDPEVWLPPLLTTLPFMVFLSHVMLLRNVARTSGSFLGLNVLAALSVAASVRAVLASNPAAEAHLALALTVAGAATFALYSLWYSRLGRTPSNKIAVGTRFPAITLQDVNGKPFPIRDLSQPALLMFFRGNWCPLCMAQIKEVAAMYREIAELGVRVLLVSPQPHENTVALAKRFDVDFDFVTDPGGKAGRELEIEMKNGLPMGMGMLGYAADTVFPTVVVLDAKGIVRWADQTDNYRVRPAPSTFLPVLRDVVGASPQVDAPAVATA